MRAAREPVVQARGLTRRYGSVTAVKNADLALHRQELLCLLGPSGCGKSSLIRLIAGLERPDAGELIAEGELLAGPNRFVPPEQRRIGIVFQDIALFPHLTAAQNVAFGLRGLPTAERRSRALKLLERFRLAHRADAYPHTLSGGEQQRVGIARALAPEPRALLLDEPFSGLDGELRAQVRETVVTGLRASGCAILVVTHDPEEAMLLGDRIALMQSGMIVQTGTPEECYRQPTSVAAATLLGRINILPASVRDGRAECLLGLLPAPGVPDGAAQVLVRPEQLGPTEGASARITGARFGGAFTELTVYAGECQLVLRVPPGSELPAGKIGLRLIGTAAVIPA